MKLSSLFKKEKSTKVKSNTQILDKKQLEKVIGGGTTPTGTMTSTAPKIDLNP